MRWSDFEEIAAKVQSVTPDSAEILADEHVYFLTRRPPVPGTEVNDSHRFEFPPDMVREMHLLPRSVMRRRIETGEFSTVETCAGEETQKKDGLPGPLTHHAEIAGCDIYWK